MVMVIFYFEWQSNVTDAFFTLSLTVIIMWLPSLVVIMMVIKPLINNGKALRKINDDNPLSQNDNQCHHQIVIFVKVVKVVK